jgi:hypothetical protein
MSTLPNWTSLALVRIGQPDGPARKYTGIASIAGDRDRRYLAGVCSCAMISLQRPTHSLQM